MDSRVLLTHSLNGCVILRHPASCHFVCQPHVVRYSFSTFCILLHICGTKCFVCNLRTLKTENACFALHCFDWRRIIFSFELQFKKIFHILSQLSISVIDAQCLDSLSWLISLSNNQLRVTWVSPDLCSGKVTQGNWWEVKYNVLPTLSNFKNTPPIIFCANKCCIFMKVWHYFRTNIILFYKLLNSYIIIAIVTGLKNVLKAAFSKMDCHNYIVHICM